MVAAMLTTLGVLLGVLVFIVVVLVGVIEIIRGTVGAIKKKETKKD